MPHTLATDRSTPGQLRAGRLSAQMVSFALAAGSSLAVTLSAYVGSFTLARLGAVILALFLLHLLRHPRFLFTREFALYAWLVFYLAIELLWTADVGLAMNTLVPAITFLLILVQFGALATFHDVRPVLFGTLVGLLIGMILYTRTSGFPFVYPADFSYNAIAGMYLIGVFVALLLSFHTRFKAPCFVVAAILLLLIVATTSIKTNLGILLGAVAAGLMYFRYFARHFRRFAVPLIALAGVAAFAVASNDALMETLQRGAGRVALGIEVLQSRDNVQGYSSLNSRARWLGDGLAGWARNPLFGHGVEAFRARFGITSHSTPVDLLYNSGLIGAGLFYGMFLCLGMRLSHSRAVTSSGVRSTIFGAIVCYLFITLSGTMHYNAFLAVFVALSTALLGRQHQRGPGPDVSLQPSRS